MEVKLISHTPEPEKVVAAAARLCYSPKSGSDIMEGFSEQEVEKFLQRLVSLGHTSPFEHASFTFSIDGVSRALSHQLVRHRIGVSFSQKSQRYVKEKAFAFVIPDSIQKDDALKEKYLAIIDDLQGKYNELLELGIAPEDARYILPNAASTNLIVTMNARSLLHFFELRCCTRAQWEIRKMANLMLWEVQAVAPHLFAGAGPTCVSMDLCFEGDMCCGRTKNVVKRGKGTGEQG